MISLFYFAHVKELTGKEKETLQWTNGTVADLMKWANEIYPGLDTSSLQVAVNEEYVLGTEQIKPGDRVAFIPPVSGG